MTLDDAGDRPGQTPAPGQHTADQGMVHAEFAALALDALLRGARVTVHLTGIARVRVDEHELADVVQKRGDHEAIARLVTDLLGEPVGRALGGDSVEAEPLGDALPDGAALEEVERASTAGDGLNGAGRGPRRP